MITKHSNKVGGSDVTHVLGNDHVLAAQKYLEDHMFANEWQVVVADDNMLMLDYDDYPYSTMGNLLPDQFYRTLGIFEEAWGSDNYFSVTESKGGNTHVLLHFNVPMSIYCRIAWQAAFGSDPKREALHLLSLVRGELNPILLFMRKVEPTQALLTAKPEQKLLTEGDGNAD